MSYSFNSNQSAIIPHWDDGTLQPEEQLPLEELSQYGQMPSSLLNLNSGNFPAMSPSPLHGAQGLSVLASSASYDADDPYGGPDGDWRSGTSSHIAPLGGGYPAIPNQNYPLNSDNLLPSESYSENYSGSFPSTTHSQNPLFGSGVCSSVFPQDSFLSHSGISSFENLSEITGPSHLEQQFRNLQFGASSTREFPSLVEGMHPIQGCSSSLQGFSQCSDELNPPILFPDQPSGASGYNLPLQLEEDQSDENLGLTKDGRPRKRRPKKNLLHLSEEEKRMHEREVNSGSTARYRRKKIQLREALEQQLQLETERNENLHQEYDNLLLKKQQYGPGRFSPQ